MLYHWPHFPLYFGFLLKLAMADFIHFSSLTLVKEMMLMIPFENSDVIHFLLPLAGSLVVNYPFDNDEQGLAIYSKSPDDAVFQQLALSYSKVGLRLNTRFCVIHLKVP